MTSAATIRVPASTANLGPGFDALSLGLARYLKISVEPAQELEIAAGGVDRHLIPTSKNNLICRVADRVAEQRKRTLPPYRMRIENEIPLARGMGSSAAAIIAGISCYEALTGDRLDEADLFRCAFEFEPHPDNLAAALYGGLIAAAVADNGGVLVSRLNIAEGMSAVVVIPSFELSTEKARSVLPDTYSRRDVVYNVQRAALTVAALTTGNKPMIREAMRDRVHQPYRAKLIPGLEDILSLEAPGLLGVALSGAGPTVLAIAEPERAAEVGRLVAAAFKNRGVDAEPLLVNIDTAGRTIDSP